MTKFDESLSNVLGTENSLTILESETNNLPEVVSTEVDEDGELVRNNLKSLIEKGNGVLDTLIELSKDEQKIGYFSTINELLQTLSNVNEKLLTVNEKIINTKLLEEKDDKKEDSSQVNNTLIMCTTDELADLIQSQMVDLDVVNAKKSNKKKKEIIIDIEKD